MDGVARGVRKKEEEEAKSTLIWELPLADLLASTRGGKAGSKEGQEGGDEGGNEGGNTSERTEQHGGSAQPKSASDPEEASPLSASEHNILREQEGVAKAAASKEEL